MNRRNGRERGALFTRAADTPTFFYLPVNEARSRRFSSRSAGPATGRAGRGERNADAISREERAKKHPSRAPAGPHDGAVIRRNTYALTRRGIRPGGETDCLLT